MRRATGPELIVFLGPTLPRAEAERELKQVAKATIGTEARAAAPLRFSLEPPARQGDVWRALARRPRALALIDGVFEASPSVWHHELLDALDGGVLVFGASSMGALRASELSARGMIGVGEIFARYRRGFDDDAAVALLHADAEHGFAPLTVPRVNAEFAIAQAASAKVLGKAEAARMQSATKRLHYQERRWDAILAGAKLSAAARARWDAFAARGLPDLKADDARKCLRESARAALARRAVGSQPRPQRRASPASALVRGARAAQLSVEHPNPGPERERDALRTLFIAAQLRAQGIQPSREQLASLESRMLAGADRESLLARSGIAEDEFQSLLHALALEELALEHASRLLPDGPAPIEATRLAQLLKLLQR